MCLKSVTSRRKSRRKYGYKVFGRNEKHELTSVIHGNQKALEKNIWLNEKDFRYGHVAFDVLEIPTFNSERYPVGWHVFDKEKDARDYMPYAVIRKVEMRGIHTTGAQLITIAEAQGIRETEVKVFVCKEIKI